MAMNFPNTPVTGQVFEAVGNPTLICVQVIS